MLRVQEVFPGSGGVLGIQVDNNYISLPGELFENLKRPGIALVHSSVRFSHALASLHQCLLLHSILKTYPVCSRKESKPKQVIDDSNLKFCFLSTQSNLSSYLIHSQLH